MLVYDLRLDNEAYSACNEIESFKNADSNAATAIIDNLQQSRGADVKIMLINLINGYNTDKVTEDYINSLIPFIAPWILLAVFSLVGWYLI